MASTPPHHPTYKVRFSRQKIRKIIDRVFPGRYVDSIEQLPSGESFNNRIYLISIAPPPDRSKEDVVLKITGQFPGSDKIQNEVASLLLLERCCPAVPTPTVLAWSNNGAGTDMMYTLKRTCEESSVDIVESRYPPNDNESSERGWILMSRRPGRRLDYSDLQGANGEKVMKQLASFTAQFRTSVPSTGRFGNLKSRNDRVISSKESTFFETLGNGLKVEVNGLLDSYHPPNQPILSALQYYQARLQTQLSRLLSEEAFTQNRAPLSPVLQKFMKTTLQNLHLVSHHSPPTFTHYDFSPRNVLISTSPTISVTGILDFEFAGFFPHEEEFANDAINNEGDWPADAYEIYLTELERLGIETPSKGFSERKWREAKLLMELIEIVAPWELRGSGVSRDEIERVCGEAKEKVIECVKKLQDLQDS